MTLTASVVPEEHSRLRGWLDQGRKAVLSRTERTDERRRDTNAAHSARDEPLRAVVAESSWDSVDSLAYDADAETDAADRPSPQQAADAENPTTILALEEDTSEDYWTMSSERAQLDEPNEPNAADTF